MGMARQEEGHSTLCWNRYDVARVTYNDHMRSDHLSHPFTLPGLLYNADCDRTRNPRFELYNILLLLQPHLGIQNQSGFSLHLPAPPTSTPDTPFPSSDSISLPLLVPEPITSPVLPPLQVLSPGGPTASDGSRRIVPCPLEFRLGLGFRLGYKG